MSLSEFQAAESRRTKQFRRRAEREAQEREAEALVEAVGQGFEQPPFITPGSYSGEEKLDVPTECVGMLIGKKGENLKRIEEQCKVSVSIEDGGGKAATAASSRRVTVKGAAANVEMALRELDFTVDAVEVPGDVVGWACGKGARHLKLVRELSGAAVVNLFREGDEAGKAAEPEANVDTACEEPSAPGTGNKPGRCWIHLKGMREHVADARLLLEAHLSYYPAFQEMDDVEAALEEQITEAQERLGRRACAAPNGNGAAPRRQVVRGAGGRGRGDGRGGKPAATSDPASVTTVASAVSGGPRKGRGKGRGSAAIGESPNGAAGQGRARSRGRAS